MPSPESAYESALRLGRQRFFREEGVPLRVVEKVYREMAAIILRIEADARAGVITAERAEELVRSVAAEMRRFGVQLQTAVTDGVVEAAEAAARAHELALGAASRAAGIAVSSSFAQVPRRALRGLMVRRGLELQGGGIAATYRTIINRNVAHAAEALDELLTSAVVRGEDYRRTTLDIARLLAGDDPKMLEILQGVGPRGGLTAKAIREGVRKPNDPGLGRLLSDARRIAVTEPNTAYHEANVQGMIQSPVVDLSKWNTSGRHDGLHSAPDVCDVLEDADLYGYGPGVYHKSVVPSLPHPACGCHVSAVLLKPAEWGRPARPVPTMRLLSGAQTKKILGKDKTDAFVASQRDMVNRKIRAAYNALAVEEAVAA